MNPARIGRLSLLAADSLDNLKEAKIVATPNVRFALENRKDLIDPAERARDVEHFEAVQRSRPLGPPGASKWVPSTDPPGTWKRDLVHPVTRARYTVKAPNRAELEACCAELLREWSGGRNG